MVDRLPECFQNRGARVLGGSMLYSLFDPYNKSLRQELEADKITGSHKARQLLSTYKRAQPPNVVERIDEGEEFIHLKDIVDPITIAIENMPIIRRDKYVPGKIETVEQWYQLFDDTLEKLIQNGQVRSFVSASKHALRLYLNRIHSRIFRWVFNRTSP